MKRVFWGRVVFLAGMLGMVSLVVGAFSPTLDLLGRPLRVEDRLKPADVVVAISGGLLDDCRSHPNLMQREGYAAMLAQNGFSRSGKLLISGTYTDEKKLGLEACRLRLAKLIRIAPDRLVIDNTARTTLDNAVNTRALMRKYGWRDIVLVTSRSHMFRAMRVFRKQGVPVNPVSIPEMPPCHGVGFDANRWSHLQRFLYEYGALLKYKWYGYI